MLRYTLRQLEYFVTTAEAGSVAAAAGRLNVSQPSVSTAIGKLEAFLGDWDRKQRGGFPVPVPGAETGLGVAILAVYEKNDILVLDSLSDVIFSHWKYKHYVPQYSMNETTRWAHVKL